MLLCFAAWTAAVGTCHCLLPGSQAEWGSIEKRLVQPCRALHAEILIDGQAVIASQLLKQQQASRLKGPAVDPPEGTYCC
jgi:hypothetical protein